MEQNKFQIVTVDSEASRTAKVNFLDLWHRCLSRWYWFVISIIICLALAGLYILRTRPMYSSYSTILIKEASARRMASSDIESVMSLNTGSSMSSKVVNEVIAFKSPALMTEVVKRLGLNTEFYEKGLFRDDFVYGSDSPVSVEFPDAASNLAANLILAPNGDRGYELRKLEYFVANKKISDSRTYKANFGDTLKTPAGKIVVKANEFCTRRWSKPLVVVQRSTGSTAAKLLSRFDALQADAKNRADVLNIMISDPSSQRANDILSTMITVYNENWVEDKNRMAVSTSQFIDERLASLEKELGDVDQDISSYKSANLIPETDNISDTYIMEIRDNNRAMQEVDNELYLYRYLRKYLQENKGNDQLIPMASSLSNLGVSSQISEYNKTLLTRNGIIANSSEKNPIVLDLDKSLEIMRAAVESSVDHQVQTLESRLASLKAQDRNASSKIANNPSQVKYLTTIGRQQKVKESLYLYLLQKREENELSQAFTAYNTRIITPPIGNQFPTSPKKKHIVIFAFLLGLFIPVAIIYFIALSDNRVHSRKDIESLSLPFLGEVPFHSSDGKRRSLRQILRKPEEKESTITVKEGKRDIINEAFRVLRTNLEFMTRGIEHPVLISTSFNPGSGKTFLTINTAAALSIKGKEVLVIDGDLRRASTSEYFGQPKYGITDYLTGEKPDLSSLIVTDPSYKHLHVLPVGTMPPNPSELIGDIKFAELVSSLKKNYDYVFIDCPPVDIVADTQIIEDVADRTIFVVRAGLMDKSLVPDIQKLYDDNKLKNMCLILNGTEAGGGYYGSHYGYYGHYGHYGHYGNYGHYYGSSKS